MGLASYRGLSVLAFSHSLDAEGKCNSVSHDGGLRPGHAAGGRGLGTAPPHLAAPSARGVEDEAKANGAGRRADRAATRPRVADEVGHVGAMAPLDEAHPAIDAGGLDRAQGI